MLMASERYVVRRKRQYLVGVPYSDEAFCRYSPSPYDGWQTRNFELALIIARQLDGKVVKFNRLTGRTEGGWK